MIYGKIILLIFIVMNSNLTSPLTTTNYNGTIHIKSIYDREFTLDNFLDIWRFDKSKIKNIFCNKTMNNMRY